VRHNNRLLLNEYPRGSLDLDQSTSNDLNLCKHLSNARL
jgi:hypothetical protein